MGISLTSDQIISGAVGFFSLCGAVVYGLKKNGFISFGSGKERRRCAETCEEHKDVSKSVDVLFNKVDAIDRKLDGVSESVQRICGYIDGSRLHKD